MNKGLFLQASNINHDCNPNCTEYYKGDTIYIKAVKDLSKGEEVKNVKNKYNNNFFFIYFFLYYIIIPIILFIDYY